MYYVASPAVSLTNIKIHFVSVNNKHLTVQYFILLSLQLFKAITFEVGQESKVSCLHKTKHLHFLLICLLHPLCTRPKMNILQLTSSSGTSDTSGKEREEARLFFHHQNMPGLPTVHLGKCPCIPVRVK